MRLLENGADPRSVEAMLRSMRKRKQRRASGREGQGQGQEQGQGLGYGRTSVSIGAELPTETLPSHRHPMAIEAKSEPRSRSVFVSSLCGGRALAVGGGAAGEGEGEGGAGGASTLDYDAEPAEANAERKKDSQLEDVSTQTGTGTSKAGGNLKPRSSMLGGAGSARGQAGVGSLVGSETPEAGMLRDGTAEGTTPGSGSGSASAGTSTSSKERVTWALVQELRDRQARSLAALLRLGEHGIASLALSPKDSVARQVDRLPGPVLGRALYNLLARAGALGVSLGLWARKRLMLLAKEEQGSEEDWAAPSGALHDGGRSAAVGGEGEGKEASDGDGDDDDNDRGKQEGDEEEEEIAALEYGLVADNAAGPPSPGNTYDRAARLRPNAAKHDRGLQPAAAAAAAAGSCGSSDRSGGDEALLRLGYAEGRAVRVFYSTAECLARLADDAPATRAWM